MKAQKFTLSVTAECLAIEVFKNLLDTASKGVEDNIFHGTVVMDDGDTVEWDIERTDVEF